MNTIVTKILAVVVILVMVGAGVVPIINAINTYTTEETETITFGTNTAHSATVTSERGTMSGTTFTEDPSGDWIQIPLAILCNTPANTYKVQEGATIYAPDTNGDIAAFTVTSGAVTGLNPALTVTFTQDTSITDADVYDMSVTSTNQDLPGIIIAVEISVNVEIPLSNVIKVFTNGFSSYYINTDHELYATGVNVSGQLGDGTTTDTLTWTKVADDVADVYAQYANYGTAGATAYYISTTGELYATGQNYYGMAGNGSQSAIHGWTKVADDVAQVACTEQYGFYLSTDNKLFISRGPGGVGTIGWQETASNVTKFVTAIDSGYSAFYINSSNELYAILSYNAGIAGNGSNTGFSSWSKVADGVKDIFMTSNYAGGKGSAFYIAQNGDLYATGYNASGQLGNGTTTDVTTWTKVAENVSKVASYGNGNDYAHRSFYIAQNGDLYATGYNGAAFGSGNSNDSTSWIKVAENVADIYPIKGDSFYISSTDDALYVTGWNTNGVNGFAGTETWQFANRYADALPSSMGKVSFVMDGTTLYYTGSAINGQFGTGSQSAYATEWTQTSSIEPTTLHTNAIESKTFTDVRGNIEGTTFTEDASGAYILVSWYNLPLNSYQIGNGEDYYTANETTVTAFEAPSTTGVTDATLTFTQNSTDSNVYDVTGTTVGASYGVVVPYMVTYDITHTVTHERLPMMNLIPLILIIMSVLFVAASLIIDRRGY